MEFIYRDDSGINQKPLGGFKNFPESKRPFYNQHRDYHSFLSGSALDDMTVRFVDVYSRQLRGMKRVPKGKGWVEVGDLYTFLKDEMFRAATTVLCGDHLLRLNPEFGRRFWEFDSYALSYLRRLPRWMARRAWRAREETLEGLERWREFTAERHPFQGAEETKVEWEEFWGSRLMRSREAMFNDLGVSKRGKAAFDLGMLWATNANVIPSTLWSLLGVFMTPGLTERVLAETESCFDEETGAMDIARLCSKPLLASIYLETLRYSVGASPARNLLVPSIELGEWKFERGSTLIANP